MNKYNLMMQERADKRTRQIRRMRDRNLSWAQIARKMGISRQRVQQLWARSTNDLGNRRAAFGASALTDGLAGKRTE